MQIKSSAFRHFETIPSRYACEGENISPPLLLSGMPKETKSLALVMDDPDATGGVTWDHWLVWNIDRGVSALGEGEIPHGAVEGATSFGSAGYGGPCPPKGSKQHRYFFKLYALDTMLSLQKGAHKDELLRAMEGHTLAYAETVGLYARK